MNRKKMFCFEIDCHVHSELKSYAREEGLVLNKLMQRIIRSYLDSVKGEQDEREDA